jgi:uncharacterized protein
MLGFRAIEPYNPARVQNQSNQMHLLYLHGYNSSPDSTKAQLFGQWIASQHPKVEFICPFMSPRPHEAKAQILASSAHVDWRRTLVVGSSMGGFWATWVAESFGCRGVLINPAVRPWEAEDHLSGPQTNYNTGNVQDVSKQDIREYREYGVDSVKRPENLWVLLQTGDEVLDYRVAEDFYRGCRITTEEGGDHSFVGIERFFDPIYRFWTE